MDERRDWTRSINNDDDGAVYIPGGHRPPPMADSGETRKISVGDFKATPKQAVQPAPAVTGQKTKKAPTKQQAKKTNYAIILVTTVFVGVIAAVFVFAMVFNSMREGDSDSGGAGGVAGTTLPSNNEANESDVALVVAPGSIEIAGLIQAIGNNRFDIYIFELSEVRSFFVEGATELRDRVGNLRPFTLFAVGEVVELSHAPNSNTIETARLSPQVQHLWEILGVRVEENQLVVGNQRYELTSNPIVRYNNELVNIAELDPIDVLTIGIFQGRYVTAIDITHGHGTVIIPYNEDIVNPTASVDGTTINVALEEGESTNLLVPSGTQRIVIRGDNIEPIIFNFDIVRGTSSTAVFAGITYRTGTLIVQSDTPDAIMHAGDRWIPLNEEVELYFGTHLITIQAFGYHSFEQEITISAEPLEITANLEAITFTRIVTITTNPALAYVYIGGIRQGQTPLNVELAPGRHQLSIELMGFLPINQPIDITADGNAIFSFPLFTDPAWVTFD